MKHNRNRFAQRDSNHDQVREWYEQLFCHVIDTSMVKFGFPDFVISCSGIWSLVECKSEDGTLTAAQERFMRDAKARVVVVTTQADVINHVTAIRRRQATGL